MTDAEATAATMQLARPSPRGTVYLLHFDRPYKHARHYLGWARNVEARLAHHGGSHGARLMHVVALAGISWQLARTWPDSTRADERRLKQRGGRSRICPICQANGRPSS